MPVALGFTALLGLLVVFQLSLAFGAPLGRFAWGGQHPGTLPVGYRVGSAVSILIYGILAAIGLDRGGVIEVLSDGVAVVAMWIVVGYLTLGVLMNAVSRSKPERFVMTPVALVLAVLALILAISGNGSGTES